MLKIYMDGFYPALFAYKFIEVFAVFAIKLNLLNILTYNPCIYHELNIAYSGE